jgi:hypothetical protein
MANGQSLADEGTSAAGFNFEAGTTGTYTVDADCRGSGELHLPLYANAPAHPGGKRSFRAIMPQELKARIPRPAS